MRISEMVAKIQELDEKIRKMEGDRRVMVDDVKRELITSGRVEFLEVNWKKLERLGHRM